MLTYDYDHLNPSLPACLLYTQVLANSLKNVRSVKNYLSGAKTFITSAGGSWSNFQSPLISTLLKGIANLSDHVELQAPPLSRVLLFRLCDGLRAWGPDGVVAAAACLFGMATFLWQSNFLPTGSRPAPHLIGRGDVLLDAAGLRVHVRTTKTLPLRSGGGGDPGGLGARVAVLSGELINSRLGPLQRRPGRRAFYFTFDRGSADRLPPDADGPRCPHLTELAPGSQLHSP